jgi:hypothetical protein
MSQRARACPIRAGDWAPPCHICTGTGLPPCHICTGTGLPPCHICTRTWLNHSSLSHALHKVLAACALVGSSPDPALARHWHRIRHWPGTGRARQTDGPQLPHAHDPGGSRLVWDAAPSARGLHAVCTRSARGMHAVCPDAVPGSSAAGGRDSSAPKALRS